MSENGTLKARIASELEGDSVRYAAVATVRRIDSAQSFSRKISIPAAYNDFVPSHSLETGRYEISATLPSGEVLQDEFEIETDVVTDIVLEGRQSPNEWRSWSKFAGARDYSPTASGFPDTKSSFLTEPQNYQIALGSIALDQRTKGEFDPATWKGWYEFLYSRWELRSSRHPGVAELDLGKVDPALSVHVTPGAPGEPTMIKVLSQGDQGPSTSFGKRRNFLVVTGAQGSRILSIPWPWERHYGEVGHEEILRVLVSERDDLLVCDPVIRDNRLGGLLAYLNAGRVGRAAQLLELAEDALFAKYENPLGAAAGGYVLLSTSQASQKGRWPHWLDNLAQSFPNIADGAILRAKWLLQQDKPDFDDAKSNLEHAFNRGLPFFTAGIVWLIEGLSLFEQDDKEIAEHLRIVRGVARSIDLSRGLTSVDLPALDRGGLTGTPKVIEHPASDDRQIVHEYEMIEETQDEEQERYLTL